MFFTAHSNGLYFHRTGGGVLAAHGSKAELPLIQQSSIEIRRLIFS